MQVFQLPDREALRRPHALAFSPDGRLLAGCVWRHVLLLDTVEGRWLPPIAADSPSCAGFVRTGSERTECAVAYLDYVTGLAVTDVRTRETNLYTLPEASGRGLVVADDGRTVYLLAHLFNETGTALWAFDTATLERGAVLARQKEVPWRLDASADGRWLVTGQTSDPRELMRVWDAVAPARRSVAIRPNARGDDVAVSHDGSRLAIVSTRGLTVWDARRDREVFYSGKHRRGVTAVACHPSRPLIATGDNKGHVFLWDHTGRVLTRYDWGLGAAYGLTFSPDGLRCAVADVTGKIVIWDFDV